MRKAHSGAVLCALSAALTFAGCTREGSITTGTFWAGGSGGVGGQGGSATATSAGTGGIAMGGKDGSGGIAMGGAGGLGAGGMGGAGGLGAGGKGGTGGIAMGGAGGLGAVLCAVIALTNEAEAAFTAQADTRFGLGAELLSGESPEDEYVFWQSPGDLGGVGVTSARSGTSVFGGSIRWDGVGQVTYPVTFEPAAGLGSGCSTLVPKPMARGFDLRAGEPLPDEQVSAALDVVWTTAVPDGLAQANSIFDAVVLLYPPAVGDFDPTIAEYVVLVNSGRDK